MKHLVIIFYICLLGIPLNIWAQNDGNKFLYKDSIYLDSVQIINTKLQKKFKWFYSKNMDFLNSNTYLVFDNLSYNDSCDNSFEVSISIKSDLDNDLMIAQNCNSCYFMISNTLVLIRYLKDEHTPDLLFKRTSVKKLFYFNQREYEKYSSGISCTKVGYRVKINENAELKIRKLYYFKHPYSFIQKCYYRIRYRKYF